MKSLLAAAAVAALIAGPAPAQPAAAGHDHAAKTPAEMHEHCKSVMGKKMDGKAPHEHSREKSGISAGPRTKPPSKAEMKKMHEKCAELMKSK